MLVVGRGDAVSVSLAVVLLACVAGVVGVVVAVVVPVGAEGAVVVVMAAVAADGPNANLASKLTVNRLSKTARVLAIRTDRFMRMSSFVLLSLLRYL